MRTVVVASVCTYFYCHNTQEECVERVETCNTRIREILSDLALTSTAAAVTTTTITATTAVTTEDQQGYFQPSWDESERPEGVFKV
jgi:hypothetical protein